jgi:hypothetical protein
LRSGAFSGRATIGLVNGEMTCCSRRRQSVLISNQASDHQCPGDDDCAKDRQSQFYSEKETTPDLR